MKPHRSFDPHRAGQLECAIGSRTTDANGWSSCALQSSSSGTSSDCRGRLRSAAHGLCCAPLSYGRHVPTTTPLPPGLRWSGSTILLKQHNHEPFDPAEAARLEVEWWHVHREHQHNNHDTDKQALTDALAELYSYAFGVPRTAVRLAAEQRALAMRYSDQWVQAGCDLESSLIAQERVALVRSYTELLAGVPQSSQKRDDCLTGDGVRFGAGAERTGKLRNSPREAEGSPAAAALEATSRVSAIITAGRPPEQATRE